MDEKKLGEQLTDEELNTAAGGAACVITSTNDECSHPDTTISNLLSGTCGFFVAKNPSATSAVCLNCSYYSGSVVIGMGQV